MAGVLSKGIDFSVFIGGVDEEDDDRNNLGNILGKSKTLPSEAGVGKFFESHFQNLCGVCDDEDVDTSRKCGTAVGNSPHREFQR